MPTLQRTLPDRAAAAAAALTLILAPLVILVVLQRPAWPAEPTAAHDRPDVTPLVECVTDNRDGTRTARLGWDNRTGRTVIVPYGRDNNLTPGRRTHDLPRTFTPGRTPPTGAFTITFSRHEVLVWRLFGRHATSAGASTCPPPRPATTAAAAAPATTSTAAPQQLAATGKPPGQAAARQPAPTSTSAPPPAAPASPATTAAPEPAGPAPSRLLTTEPVAFAVVDALPSLAVGLLVLSAAATNAVIWRRRGPR